MRFHYRALVVIMPLVATLSCSEKTTSPPDTPPIVTPPQLPVAAGYPVRSETIAPLRKAKFNATATGNCSEFRRGGTALQKDGHLIVTGATDAGNQMDPQVAVGGGYVMHATNSGFILYTKAGAFVQGVSQRCFNDGIDPKLLFDVNNRVFLFDLWWYYDAPGAKPANISVSETSDPTGAWNTYPVSLPNARDGGAVGSSRAWIGYSFPGGTENTFVLSMADAKAGRPTAVYHFTGSLGHPVNTQDATDDLHFFQITSTNMELRRVTADQNGFPFVQLVFSKPHGFTFINSPPQSRQLGSTDRFSSGDRNPKNVVIQGGSLWFSQAVESNGRTAVQWSEVSLASGTIVQTGLIRDSTSSYIQTTIAVNKNRDVLVGFQESSAGMYVSPRFAFRNGSDPLGTLRPMVRMAEGGSAIAAGAWGDYSGSAVDGDNVTDLWTVQSMANATGKSNAVIAKATLP
jgi:hypothetical protein